MTSIPKPSFPVARPPRRSAIAQAAAANNGLPIEPAHDTAAPGRDSATSTAPEDRVTAQTPEVATETSPRATARDAADTRPVPQRRRARDSSVAQAKVTGTSATNKRLAQSRDILLSVPDDLKERMVNTIAWTTPHTGINQQSKFIRKAISELCSRLETQFNDGQSFPPPADPDA